jgi:hypothetical protein
MTAPPTAPSLSPAAPATALATALAWLAWRARLDDEARAAVVAADPAALAPGATDPEPLVRALLHAERAADALRVVACALPPREGVWWAWLAARHAVHAAQARADAARQQPADGPAAVPPPLPPSAAQHAALAAVERWITHPADEQRRAAWDAAQEAGMDTAAGCVAAAAFLTGGSVTPAGAPFVPPPAGIHVIMASTGAMLAAVATDPTRLMEIAGGFAQQGMELVRRLGGWDATAAMAKQAYDTQAYHHAEASKPPAASGAAG